MNPNLPPPPLLDELRGKSILEAANELFRRYRGLCFWNSPKDLVITEAMIPFVRQRLRDYGGRDGFILSGLLRKRDAE
jgi:hypothetical protein